MVSIQERILAVKIRTKKRLSTVKREALLEAIRIRVLLRDEIVQLWSEVRAAAERRRNQAY